MFWYFFLFKDLYPANPSLTKLPPSMTLKKNILLCDLSGVTDHPLAMVMAPATKQNALTRLNSDFCGSSTDVIDVSFSLVALNETKEVLVLTNSYCPGHEEWNNCDEDDYDSPTGPLKWLQKGRPVEWFCRVLHKYFLVAFSDWQQKVYCFTS